MNDSRITMRAPGPALTSALLLLLSSAGLPLPSLSAEVIPDLPPLEYQGPEALTASIYATTSQPQRLLYKFKRVVARSGSSLRVRREYTYPDGRPAAREHVLYEGNGLMSYELEDLQTGAAGSAKVERDPKRPANSSLAFQYSPSASARARSAVKSEPLQPDTLVNDMVGPFLAAHWEALVRAEKVSCRYAVVSRRETVGFAFLKESDSKWRGRDVLIVKMEPASLFISALVDPLFFTVEKAPPHRVLQYVGRTTPKLPVRGKWKDLDAVTVFDW